MQSGYLSNLLTDAERREFKVAVVRTDCRQPERGEGEIAFRERRYLEPGSPTRSALSLNR